MVAKRCLCYKKVASAGRLESSPAIRLASDLFGMGEKRFKQPIHFYSSSWTGRLRSRNSQQSLGTKNILDTSDYGTASESSRKSSLNDSAELCSWGQQDGVCSLPITPATSDVESEATSEHFPLWTDSEIWDRDCKVNQTFQNFKQDRVSVKLLHKAGVVVLVPNVNLTGNCGYSLQINRNVSYKPYSLIGIIHASLVISLEPHGTQFFGENPALIFLPLSVLPGPTDRLECLYSNTSLGANPVWERLTEDQFHLSDGKVIISTHHFSLFTAVIRPQPVESCRLIRQRSGGRLRNPAAPGVEINFPRRLLHDNIIASVQVIFIENGCDPCESSRALASPIIMVGPHGYQFGVNQPPVTIQLPLPDYMQICQKFGASSQSLTVWQSNTSEKEAACWEKVDVDVTIKRDAISRCHTAVFPVYHFSFFKIMWDILSNTLLEAKMGMTHFYPYISFSMMCQAFMEENADNNRFGLEVICHRSDRRLPELTNFKHRVGASLKPKLMKPGKILVRLKSQLFEADIEAGEESEMVKQEHDFRGRDFEKQYACRYYPLRSFQFT